MAKSSPTDSEKLLAQSCLQKKQAGIKPTREEVRALEKVQKHRDEQLRWKAYEDMPKGHYVTLSGRQHKVLNEQARRYRLPLLGPTVQLAAVLTAFHDLLAEHGDKIMDDEAGLMSGENTPALEKWREEKFRLARLDRMQREGLLIPRNILHDLCQFVASELRAQGEFLQREAGPDSLDQWNERLDGIERRMQELLAGIATTPDENLPSEAE